MDQGNHSSSAFVRAQTGKGSDGSKSYSFDKNEHEHVFITHIRATDVVSGLRRLPAGFYVTVEANGKTTETSNKLSLVGRDAVEWDENILLPSERSSTISFKVYASYEFGPRLGDGELLGQLEITVGDVLDRNEQLRPIWFLVQRKNDVLPSCSSLQIITDRRIYEVDEYETRFDVPQSDTMSPLARLTDTGHRSLLRYRQLERERDLEEAIECFERARDMCPLDYSHRSAVQSNLATAMFIHSQVNRAHLELDVSIALYRDTLRLRSSSCTDYGATALDLGFALLARFQRLGDEADRTEAKELLYKVMELSPVESYGYRAASFALQIAEISLSVRAQIDNANPDDQESIRMARASLLDVSDWDPGRPALLVRLGELLHRRFNGNGKLVDVHEAILMFDHAVRLVPDGHPDKPSLLNNLGNSLLTRFEHLGDLADINKSISVLEEAVRLTPDGQSQDPASLSNLGKSLLNLFEHLGNLADINKSVLMLEEAVHLAPNGHPEKPAHLSNLGNSLRRRFERLGDVADIKKSILVLEEAVRLTPSSHPEKPAWLKILGTSLLNRFELLGDLADINKSVLTLEEAVRLTPNDHPDKPARLNNLGNALLYRFERLGALADINKSILMFEEALHLTPNGHPGKPARLSNFGTTFFRRFDHLGDLADINKSVSMLEEAVRLTPNGYPDRPTWLNNLGNSLLLRFERLGDLADINESISVKEEAVHLTPDDHPDKPALLQNLGSSLLTRFERLGDLADIKESVSMQEEVVCLTPDGHPRKPARLNNLGNSLLHRFNHLGDLADINKSILVLEEAVHLTPNGHPGKPGWLSNLGNSFMRRFECLGDLMDVNKSISTFEEASQLTPNVHPDRPRWLNNLANSSLRRFEHLGDLLDINRSISMSEEAVRLTPVDHPIKPRWLISLGASLFCRFERLGDLADLNKSISMLEEVVHLIPHGHPNRPTGLNNLANTLSCRFERLGDHVDIDRSILMLEEAVDLTPSSHPAKPVWLNSLGTSLLRRSECLGDLVDIEKSILVLEEAVKLTPHGHPDKPIWLKTLGGGFIKYFEHAHDTSSLSTATLHFSAAACSSSGPASTRFRAARSWVSCACREGNHQALLNAYTTIIKILPELAWFGLPLTERHRVLLDAADVVRDAAAAALDAGLPNMAVEWLEQGRSIVWSQLLQLRTPVDELRVKHPALADRFQQISQELEHATSRRNVTAYTLTDGLTTEPMSLEKQVQKHHMLALTREKLLADIRSLPGFDQFLLPKPMVQLAALARSGPVVYLNAGKQRCDALILMVESSNAIHVPLRGISYGDAERLLCFLLKRDYRVMSRDDTSPLIPDEENSALQQLLNMSLMGNDVEGSGRDGKLQQFEGRTADGRLRLILAFLWKEVVSPVLEALGMLTPHSATQEMTRIFWCPTGPFAFLPIHAAGLYGTADAGPKLSDFAISSYIPTLSALAPSARKDCNGPSSTSSIHLTAVPQPPTDGLKWLACVDEEIDHIRTLSARSPFVTVQDSDGTVEDVMEKITRSDWVHFACHGVQDLDDPLNSGLCLADRRRLKLSDIIRLSRPQGGLAFLSACQTAQGDEKLSEESVHLAAGMLLAGYGGVIATMWSIMDRDAPRVTKDVYAHLFRDGKVPDSMEAAEALHHAVQNLRDSGASFSSWVPFIHVGR